MKKRCFCKYLHNTNAHWLWDINVMHINWKHIKSPFSAQLFIVKDRGVCKMDNIDGFVQEKHNSSALAMELRLSCTNPLI